MTPRGAVTTKRESISELRSDSAQHSSGSIYDHSGDSSIPMRGSSDEGFIHLLDSSGSGGTMMPPLSISDIQDVDLSAFPTSSAISTPGQPSDASCSTAEAISTRPSTAKESTLVRTKQVCEEAEGQR
ncbi:hypothetical protein PsorP6_008734 [Peronosclerospora sorghi]|uniref:Uncharacterized protein n=1 Tax=Peronosclerospora sorghi TaxID=230839 RepID=A0ACC0W0D9_9STRA|nr:hypothetical protein PsorP6_008734 [Peronosclerospora sorghi]